MSLLFTGPKYSVSGAKPPPLSHISLGILLRAFIQLLLGKYVEAPAPLKPRALDPRGRFAQYHIHDHRWPVTRLVEIDSDEVSKGSKHWCFTQNQKKRDKKKWATKIFLN